MALCDFRFGQCANTEHSAWRLSSGEHPVSNGLLPLLGSIRLDSAIRRGPCRRTLSRKIYVHRAGISFRFLTVPRRRRAKRWKFDPETVAHLMDCVLVACKVSLLESLQAHRAASLEKHRKYRRPFLLMCDLEAVGVLEL